MIGTLLNERYRLDSEIGRGGMGVVYRAREAEAEFEAMDAHGYVERVRGRLEILGSGSSTS